MYKQPHNPQQHRQIQSQQQNRRTNKTTHKNLQSAEGTRFTKRGSNNNNNNNQKNINDNNSTSFQKSHSLQQSNTKQQYHSQQGDPSNEAINNLIHEYLLKNGMNKTLEIFSNEIKQPQQQKQQHNNLVSDKKKSQQNSNKYQEELLKLFDFGNRDDFFQKWNKYIPTNIRLGDDKANKLEFYLHIYFYIFHLHPSSSSKKNQSISRDNVEFFKNYLDNRGKDLSKTSEFLQFYALPYIDKPQEHQALQHLFQEEWMEDLKERLQEFLSSVFPQESTPLLYTIYQNYLKNPSESTEDNSYNAQLQKQKQLQQQSYINQSQQIQEDIQSYKAYIGQIECNNKELLNVIQEFHTKYNALQANYKQFAESAKQNLMDSQNKWFQIAQDLVMISKELIQMIEQNQSQGVDFDFNILEQLQQKLIKYENFLSTNIEEYIHQSQDYSIFDKVSLTQDIDNSIVPLQQQLQHNNMVQPNARNYILQSQLDNGEEADNPYVPLDYEEIKKIFLQNQDPTLTCAILQALRWRITKTKGAYIRREVVISYATFDIIGCKNQGLQQELLLNDKKVQEFTLRLINSLASDYHGRSYLVQSDSLVKMLIHILIQEQEESSIRRNSLGALQKLSLRRRPQIVMIKNDLIQWIVQTLKDRDNLSDYSNEYATALFMNLSLRSLGKDKCEIPIQEVLEVLDIQLEHDNSQVRTFVNGTLYSLLSRQSIREKARAMGFHDRLTYLMEQSEERFTKQIQYIIEQLNKDSPDEEILSDTDEDNDIDDIEDEEDLGEDEETEEFLYAENLLLGEELLMKQFALSGQDAIKQNQMTKSIIEDVVNKKNASQLLTASRMDHLNKDMPFNRPQTPMSISQISQNNPQNNEIRKQPASNQYSRIQNIKQQHQYQQQQKLQQQQQQQNQQQQQQYQHQQQYQNQQQYLNKLQMEQQRSINQPGYDFHEQDQQFQYQQQNQQYNNMNQNNQQQYQPQNYSQQQQQGNMMKKKQIPQKQQQQQQQEQQQYDYNQEQYEMQHNMLQNNSNNHQQQTNQDEEYQQQFEPYEEEDVQDDQDIQDENDLKHQQQQYQQQQQQKFQQEQQQYQQQQQQEQLQREQQKQLQQKQQEYQKKLKNIKNDPEKLKFEQDAFMAHPKIPRTPPLDHKQQQY